jgi:hypothetical protein
MSLTSVPASSAIIVGFFGLTEGHHLICEENGEMVNIYYTLYHTTISALNADNYINVDIHIYSPPHAPLLPNMTIAYIMAKLYAPSNGKVLLDSLVCFPFLGDPTQDDYDNLFLEELPNFVFLLGNMPTAHTSNASGLCFFMLNVSEYIRDTARSSQIMYVYFVLFYSIFIYLYHIYQGACLMAIIQDGIELDHLYQIRQFKFLDVLGV